MLTSDPTSDSSDTGGSGKSNDDLNSVNDKWTGSSDNNATEPPGIQNFQPPQDPEKENKPEEITKLLDNADVVMKSDSVSNCDNNYYFFCLLSYFYFIMSENSVYRKMVKVAPIPGSKT